jgi:hypothetical protein
LIEKITNDSRGKIVMTSGCKFLIIERDDLIGMRLCYHCDKKNSKQIMFSLFSCSKIGNIVIAY